MIERKLGRRGKFQRFWVGAETVIYITLDNDLFYHSTIVTKVLSKFVLLVSYIHNLAKLLEQTLLAINMYIKSINSHTAS